MNLEPISFKVEIHDPLTSQTSIASWLVPFLPCCVNRQAMLLAPFRNNLSGIRCSSSSSATATPLPFFFLVLLFFILFPYLALHLPELCGLLGEVKGIVAEPGERGTAVACAVSLWPMDEKQEPIGDPRAVLLPPPNKQITLHSSHQNSVIASVGLPIQNYTIAKMLEKKLTGDFSRRSMQHFELILISLLIIFA